MRPPWLDKAVTKLGQHEIAGGADNSFIVECLRRVGLPHEHDETAWCSAFMNWCMEESGHRGTGRANARSWLAWGKSLAAPELGCVVVFSRPPKPAEGHVGLFLADLGSWIVVLGGNQDNQVGVKCYPKDHFLGYRWPV